jgi:phage tail tape-measure protein
MKNIFVMFVLFLGISGYTAEKVHAEILSKTIKTVVAHGPDAANLILEPTTENAVSMVGDGIGSYAGGAGGAYVGAIVGTAIFPGAGTAIGGFVGYWGGIFGGGYVGEKAAKKVYQQFR